MAERPSLPGSVPSSDPAVPELGPAARELLRAFKAHESPTAAERDLGFAALQSRVAHDAEEPAPAANGGFYSSVRTIARATLVTVAVAAAVLLAIKAVGSGVTALADRARQPAMEAPYQGEAGSDGGQAVTRTPRLLPPRRGGAGDASATAVPEAAVPEPVVHEATLRDEPPPASPASPAESRPSRSRPAATAGDLDAELALIKRATEAKKAGRVADGLAALREHAQRFPKGLLASERMVLKAELYCAAGRVQEADALVESFLREHPGHALVGRMRNVCRE